jgi:unsaturated rhamnogalacturonyl hydrolase
MGFSDFAATGNLERQYTPLQWAEKACAALMKKFAPEQLPPEGRWHYHQGVFLLGMERCWKETNQAGYFEYIKEWVDRFIQPDGSISDYNSDELDDIQPGILLFDLWEQTGDERYRKALQTLVSWFPSWKLNAEGGFWHKTRYPNQMWLDSMYMAGPLGIRYGRVFGESAFYDLLVRQALLMEEHLKDPKTGLFYHGWDQSKQAPWADPETGCAPEFWGRALGWYPAALLDMLEYLPETHPEHRRLQGIVSATLAAIVKYQDPASGLWYQVLDKGDRPDNWLETSCSCLFAYSIAKAVRMGYLQEEYLQYAWKAYRGVIERLSFDAAGEVVISDICVGTGIGDYAHYIARPRSENDLHGTGAFILMCVEMSRA